MPRPPGVPGAPEIGVRGAASRGGWKGQCVGPAVLIEQLRITVMASSMEFATTFSDICLASSIAGAMSIHCLTSACASANPASFTRKVFWPLPNCIHRNPCAFSCFSSSSALSSFSMIPSHWACTTSPARQCVRPFADKAACVCSRPALLRSAAKLLELTAKERRGSWPFQKTPQHKHHEPLRGDVLWRRPVGNIWPTSRRAPLGFEQRI